jgi:regulator of protease activity HflC (stomatin/prohibitin superfamily)
VTWTSLNLLQESPLLEDRVVCAIADASVDEVYDVSLIEIINDEFDWITEDQVQLLVRAAAKAAIEIVRAELESARPTTELEAAVSRVIEAAEQYTLAREAAPIGDWQDRIEERGWELAEAVRLLRKAQP